jgi:hypothetical protein
MYGYHAVTASSHPPQLAMISLNANFANFQKKEESWDLPHSPMLTKSPAVLFHEEFPNFPHSTTKIYILSLFVLLQPTDFSASYLVRHAVIVSNGKLGWFVVVTELRAIAVICSRASATRAVVCFLVEELTVAGRQSAVAIRIVVVMAMGIGVAVSSSI